MFGSGGIGRAIVARGAPAPSAKKMKILNPQSGPTQGPAGVPRPGVRPVRGMGGMARAMFSEGGEVDEKSDSGDLKMIADDLLSAVKGGDSSGVLSALKAFHICIQKADVEQDEEEG